MAVLMGFGPGWEQDVLSIPQSSHGAGIPVRMGGAGEVGADLRPRSQRGSDLGWVIDVGQRGTGYLGGVVRREGAAAPHAGVHFPDDAPCPLGEGV